MGRVNNPSACVTKAVNGETREEEIAWRNATVGQTWEREPVPEWDDEGGGGEWRTSAAWYERDDEESDEDYEKETMRRLMATEEARIVGEPSA